MGLFLTNAFYSVTEHLLIFSPFIDAGFWHKGKLTEVLRRTFCSFYKRVLAKAERMTLFALISGWNFMIQWFEVIITRENSFTKGQWNKGKKALFSMILISFFFSLSVLFLSLILCPLWISFDHGSWDWSCFLGVPILAFDQPESNHVQRVITGSLHRWLKFITLLDCKIFLYREIKLTENEMLTIDCV